MKDKVVLVTGANGGLGKYVTQAFLETGATVVGVSRKIQQSDFKRSTFTALPAEISTAAEAKSMVETLVARFGRLDILVHTVGGFAGGPSIAETDDATFQGMFDVNLNSTFYLLRAALPRPMTLPWWSCVSVRRNLPDVRIKRSGFSALNGYIGRRPAG